MTEPVRTSALDTLRIESVVADGSKGEIGMTLCPGRKGTSSQGGRYDRDIVADVRVVEAWAPALAVSLLEEREYARLDVANFKDIVARSCVPWVFAPISDGGVAGTEFETAWSMLGPRLRNIVRRGGRVLVHCRAGLGRTGMVAARLLVELGMQPTAAVQRVRAARPGTIENDAQEAHVHAARSVRVQTSRTDGIAGSMFGAAVGDALGSAFEFLSAATIERALGEPYAWHYTDALPRSLLHPRAAGKPTDDTALSLSVAHVVARAKTCSAADFGAAFVADLASGSRFAEMFWTGGPGGATTRALGRLRAGADAARCGADEDGGNGAAMRAHPVGMLAGRPEVLRVAAVQARVTHGHPAAIAAAAAVAALVYDALAGFEPTIDPPQGIDDPQFLAAWQDAHQMLEPRRALPAHLQNVDMSGWVTVASAHAISLIYKDDPARAIAAAAASGGDTDTVASIVGGIARARHGTAFLKGEWLDRLSARGLVDDAIAALLAR